MSLNCPLCGAIADRLVSVKENNGMSASWGFSCSEVYGEMVGLLELSVM